MQPISRHGTRTATRSIATVIPATLLLPEARRAPWVCVDCLVHSQTRTYRTGLAKKAWPWPRRTLTSTSGQRQDDTTTRRVADSGNGTPRSSSSNASTLPSAVEQRRGQLSKDLSKFVDNILARASVASQHINVYMGTDYSGIEAVRTQIIEQERTVKARHLAVDAARTAHAEAFSSQAAAQKEIVALLERKSSWTPTDLERYMSLVRSEHVNDQAVQAAKDSLTLAERELEEARSLLERLERKQYHEEQIWSDTIRRNSTWVTFGLMGVNIVLLLAQILVFEPYRRRKIVRDVKEALDERTLHPPSAAVVEVERQVDEIVEPAGTAVEDIEAAEQSAQATEQPLDAIVPETEAPGATLLAAGELLPEEATDLPAMPPTNVSKSHPQPSKLEHTLEACQERLRDLFSDRIVQLKQVELTTIAMQSAATGVAAMGLVFLLLKPR